MTLLLLAQVARADVSTPTDTEPTEDLCADSEDGAQCILESGDLGECSAGVCEEIQSDKGCSTAGTRGLASGLTLLSLGLLGLRRRR
ncbi:MAG: hypothetical protein H6738_18825 [Alphaproteobacteria bacterium]|nr:hypothetical protein [Alphaproteobacteria bacterium]MCB9698842.1 hypothetical protein [Alphaproteobacteria bacterium]